MHEHEWERDPEQRGEGLACSGCRMTEAEAEQSSQRFAELTEMADDPDWLGI